MTFYEMFSKLTETKMGGKVAFDFATATAVKAKFRYETPNMQANSSFSPTTAKIYPSGEKFI